MDVGDRTALILGGWGLVGSAIARAIVARKPRTLVVHSLRQAEAEEAVAALAAEHPGAGTRYVAAWGNIFVREDLKDRPRPELLADRDARRAIVSDTMDELSETIVRSSYLYRLLTEHRPAVVIDCINTATAFAYQDVYSSVHRVQAALAGVAAGAEDIAALRDAFEVQLMALTLPPLIRHVQIAREALRDAGTEVYLKVGTTGTGGMGLNVPYTHSEEQPSRLLLSKSSIAGAHSMLLYLFARTPDAPVVKEVKPSAVIAWKRIGMGPVRRQGRPIALFDCPPERAMDPAAAVGREAAGWEALGDRVLESVYIDTGENGMFSSEEFETVTALGQMGFVTPEEIADSVLIELEGGTTGREVVAALDGATLGPSYRAGVMRHRALEEMRRLERESGLESVAFEMLGPPRLSKLLYEAHILRRVRGTLAVLAGSDPDEDSREGARLVTDDGGLRARILSIGIPILMPDGRLLRGPEMKIPPRAEEAPGPITPEMIERWVHAGWVDLRPSNMARWKARAQAILDGLMRHPEGDTSSRLLEDHRYWEPHDDLHAGRVAAWIFGVESGGAREKAQ